jgi:hypothetical protein
VDQLAFQPCEAPCFGSDLNDPLYGGFDAFFFAWVGEMLDRTDDFVNNCTSSGIDTLLGATAGERCK